MVVTEVLETTSEAPSLLYGAFELNNGITTALIEGSFNQPEPKLTPAGELIAARGIDPSEQHYEKPILPIGIYIRGDTKADALALRDQLWAEMAKDNVLTYTPFPVTNPSEVYYLTTFRATGNIGLTSGYYISGKIECKLNVKVRPYMKRGEVVVFDKTTVLAEIDGEDGQWSAAGTWTKNGNDFFYGSYSGKGTVAANNDNWIARSGGYSLNLSPFLTVGWVTIWAKIAQAPTQPNPLVRIGSDPSNYREYQITLSQVGKSSRIVHPGSSYTPLSYEYAFYATYSDYVADNLTVITLPPFWQPIYFDFNAPTNIVGNPSMDAVAFFEVFLPKPTYGNTGPIQIDNVTVSNGPVCAPRARAPFVTTIHGINTNAPASFLMQIKKSANVNRIYIGKKEDGVDPFPNVCDDPVLNLSGWTDPASTQNDPNCHQGNYQRYSISNTGAKIHVGKFLHSQSAGRYKLFARVRTYDGGTVTVRRIGQDKNHPDWDRSPVVKSITSLSNAWQFLDLGPVSLPLHDVRGDADPTTMYSCLGLEVTGSGGAANFDVDFTDIFPVDGDGRIIISPAELQYLSIDTRTPGTKGVFGSIDGTADNSFGLGHRSRGGLKTLDAGVNNISIYARDTSTPSLVPEIDITKISYIPTVLIGKG